MRGVQVKLWDPWRTHAIPERLGVWSRQGAIQIHVYLTLPYLSDQPIYRRGYVHRGSSSDLRKSNR